MYELRSCRRAPLRMPCLAPELIGSRSGFDPGFFQDLLRIEAANFWFLNRGRLILRLLDEHFPASRSLLEIGCGTGSVLGAIQEHRPELCLIGSELHPEGIAIAGRRLGQGVTLLQFDARAIGHRYDHRQRHGSAAGPADGQHRGPGTAKVTEPEKALLKSIPTLRPLFSVMLRSHSLG